MHNNNQIYPVSPTCDEADRLSDRVYFLSNLCTGKQDISSKDTEYLKGGKVYDFDEIMASKIKKCGIRSACLRHFGDDQNGEIFCKDIQEMGECKLNSSIRTEIPQNIMENIRKVYAQLDTYISACIDPLVTTRQRGCPSTRYLKRPSNEVFKTLFEYVKNNQEILVKSSMFDLATMTFLSTHPKTSPYLSAHEWAGILEFLKSESSAGETKFCREKINLRKSLQIEGSSSCK